jgi:hypothetical protein
LYNSIYTSMSKIDFEWKNTILLAKSITWLLQNQQERGFLQT